MTPDNKYETEICFIEDTPTESPTGAIAIYLLGMDPFFFGPWSVPLKDQATEVHFIEDTPTESPTGAIVAYVLGTDMDASLIGEETAGHPLFLLGL